MTTKIFKIGLVIILLLINSLFWFVGLSFFLIFLSGAIACGAWCLCSDHIRVECL